MANYPDIDTIDATEVADMSEESLAELVRDLVSTLGVRAENGLFDGALELADPEAAESLRSALWNTASAGEQAEDGETNDLIDLVGDEELQEIAAAVFQRAHLIGDPAYAKLSDLETGFCEEVAMIIEDWQTRYQADEAEAEDDN